MRALIWLVVAFGVIRFAWQHRCSHVDEHGISRLTWETEPGRVRGRCDLCGRVTAGWSVPWRATYTTPKRIRRGKFVSVPFRRRAA